MGRMVRVLGSAVVLAVCLAATTIVSVAAADSGSPSQGCQLSSAHGQISHVIYIQFDNVHFTRDNPNVPSDLEQMPNLLNFMEQNGALLTNHHTPLISHTADDIVTSLTGVYGDRTGVPVANSYGYFKPNGTTGFASSFGYWTSPTPDGTPNMLAANGLNAPAPWVPYTRAGCNVGEVATANTVLENTGNDITTVFGANSPEAAEAKANPQKAAADFVGIAVHCAAGNALCANGQSDQLPAEPGGYQGFDGLFGAEYVDPQISPAGPLTDLNGNVIQDQHGNVGFPGFNGMSAAVSLSYVAAMQEHGVPVTYAYISDAHDNNPNGPAFGPGQAGYVATLKAYNDAFGKFFARLAADGINSSNTLFVFTADEGDHFVGGPPSPANCDGVTVPCTYSQIGELDTNMTGLLATEQGITTPFSVHSDSAPTVYITGDPARDAAITRTFERATSNLTASNPLTGQTDNLTVAMADPVEMQLLHMITADPARTPTFTWFAQPDYFMFTGAPNCNSPCVQEEAGFAWNHGDVTPQITTTWLGMVGPGVAPLGIDSRTWSDETDIRPTMMMLLGLKDDYGHDGRALTADLDGWAIPAAAKRHGAFRRLAAAYKQIEATVGPFGLATLTTSTNALASGSASDDSTYTNLENELLGLSTRRDALAAQMIALLEGAEFDGKSITQHTAHSLEAQARQLLADAGASTP